MKWIDTKGFLKRIEEGFGMTIAEQKEVLGIVEKLQEKRRSEKQVEDEVSGQLEGTEDD